MSNLFSQSIPLARLQRLSRETIMLQDWSKFKKFPLESFWSHEAWWDLWFSPTLPFAIYTEPAWWIRTMQGSAFSNQAIALFSSKHWGKVQFLYSRESAIFWVKWSFSILQTRCRSSHIAASITPVYAPNPCILPFNQLPSNESPFVQVRVPFHYMNLACCVCVCVCVCIGLYTDLKAKHAENCTWIF